MQSAFATTNPQPKLALTLKDAILLAVRQNPDVETAELDRVIQKYALVVAKNEFQPQYSLSGQLNDNPGETESLTFDVNPAVSLKNHYGTEVSLSSFNSDYGKQYNPAFAVKIMQPLIRGFGKEMVMADLNNAFDTEAINKLNLKNQIITTVTNVIADYMAVTQSQETLTVDQATLKSYQQTVTKDKELIAAGNMARTDIVQTQAKVASQKATIQNDINELEQQKLQLFDTIGLQPDTTISIPAKINFQTIAEAINPKIATTTTLSHYKNLALQNDITYQIDGITLHTLQRQLSTAKNNNLPELNLTASKAFNGNATTDLDYGNSGLETNMLSNTYIGLELNVPIDNKELKQEVINARIAIDKAEVQYKEQQRQIEINTTNDFHAALNNKTQLQLTQQALLLQHQNVTIAKRKYSVGRISTFEILNDQEQLLTAEQELINSQINYINSLATFDQTLGTTLTHWDIRVKY